MNTVSEILFTISNGLLIPVIVLLLILFAWSIVLLFNYLTERSSHTEWIRKVEKVTDGMNGSNIFEILGELPEKGCQPFSIALAKLLMHKYERAACEMIVANYEVEVEKILSKKKMMVKIGPMLGLMGTLIPMGPALVGLASGDISSMAYNMQMAFSTTVVGMVVAAIGSLSLSSESRFYAHTLNDLQFICETLCNNETEQ